MSSDRLKKRVKDEYSEEEYEDFETPPCEGTRRGKTQLGRSSKNLNGSFRGGRHDNSLGVLTKKFVKLIQSSENKCIDLNDAVRVRSK